MMFLCGPKVRRLRLGMVLALLVPGVLQAQTGRAAMEERVARLEQLVAGDGLLDLMVRLERLQRDLRELRGEVEQLSHSASQLGQRQREQDQLLDQRLRKLEASLAGVLSSAPAASLATPDPAPPPAPAEPPRSLPEPSTLASPEPLAVVPASPDTGDPAKDQATYEAAFNLLREGRYDTAMRDLQRYLQLYPQGRYADNAQYWLGEAYYVNRQFDAALAEFRKVVDRYPDSPRHAQALLKLGFAHHELGDSEAARRILEALVRDHPGTPVARLAEERLQRVP